MGDAPHEQDDPLALRLHDTVGPCRLAPGNGVVDNGHLLRIDSVTLHDHALREVAHGNDAVRLEKALPLDCEDAGVHAPAAAVELQRVDVKDEGAPAFAPGVKGRGDGEPLVGVYDIEGNPTGDQTRRFPVALHLVEQIGTVVPRACKEAPLAENPVVRLRHVGSQGRVDGAYGDPR